MNRLYNVTPASGARTVAVIADSMKSAIAIAKSDFRSHAKLKAAMDADTTVGGNVTRAVHANRGIMAAYRLELAQLIAEMHGSTQYWVTAAYRNNPPRMLKVVDIAEDAAPSNRMRKILAELAKRWIKKFDDAAPRIAEAYIRAQFKATDASFKAALKDAGWTVKFQLTPAMRDALQAQLEENRTLIKSIPEQYMNQVNGAVMRSYAAGRDLETMTKELKQIYPKAADRAETIARDQSNKANATVNRTRSLQLGITQGIWMHSSAGKVPRPSHQEAGRKKLVFDIAKGAYLDGKWVLPGQLINCRCTWRCKLPI